MSDRSAFSSVIRKARSAGCVVEHGGRHIHIRTPSGVRIVCSGTPSDVNAWRNLRKDLRKAGVEI